MKLYDIYRTLHLAAVLLAVASCSKEEPVSAAEYVMDGAAFYVGFARGMR